MADANATRTLVWLNTDDGKPRGLALICDLERDADGWELWGPAAGQPPLNPLERLLPADGHGDPDSPGVGLAVNGGYWNEHLHPVGVTAGAQGIFAARGHPGGFAIAGRRAWIGELRPSIRLRPVGDAAGIAVPINPRPRLRRTPYLIDPAASPWPVTLEPPATIAWLETGDGAPLQFNVATTLTVRSVGQIGSAVNWTTVTQRLLIFPAGIPDDWPLNLPAAGVRYRLDPRLEPLEQPVRLATCGGPMLVRDGETVEGLRDDRAWRTAVGTDREGRRVWLIVLAHGRDGAPGATLAEAAETLRALGAWTAINFDGGSSTSILFPPEEARLQTLFPFRRPIHHGLLLRGAFVGPKARPIVE